MMPASSLVGQIFSCPRSANSVATSSKLSDLQDVTAVLKANRKKQKKALTGFLPALYV
jgi:hypothetical protein